MTTEERLENVERELRRVKRDNRRLLLAGAVVGVGVLVTWALLHWRVGSIRATALMLQDENGKVRASLATLKDGPALVLYDEKGKGGAALTVFKDAPSLALFDEKGKARAQLCMVKDAPGMALFDEKGEVRAGLVVDKDGPGLVLWDEKGQVRAELGRGGTTNPDGTMTTFPESSLRLFGPDGKMIWKAP